MPKRRVARIVTGGQSGVDRAATDVAIEFGVPYGGWVPLDGWAEDFPDPPGLLDAYPGFRATPPGDPAVRTERNVADSDRTLVLVPEGVHSPGTELTRVLAVIAGRLAGVIDPFSSAAPRHLTEVALQLPEHCTVNVAGPRATECPGIYEAVRALLRGGAAELFGGD